MVISTLRYIVRFDQRCCPETAVMEQLLAGRTLLFTSVYRMVFVGRFSEEATA